MGISLAVFCGHTLYQIWHGVTTNETPKWSRVNWRFKNQVQPQPQTQETNILHAPWGLPSC